MTRLLPVAFAAGVCFGLVRLVAWRRLSVRTPLDLWIALLTALLPLTLIVTPSPSETTPQVLRLLAGIALYYAVVNASPSVTRPTVLLGATLGLGMLVAIVTPLVATGTPTKFSLVPAFFYSGPALLDEAINFNVMAGTLGLLFPFPVAVVLFGDARVPRWLRILAWATALALGLMLLWTQSRGAMIGVVAMGVLLFSLRWRWGWLIVFAVAAAIGVLLLVPGIGSALNPLALEGPGGSLGSRVLIWRRALGMIQDFPFTGVGMGAFGYTADRLYPFYVVPAPFPHAHNLFLQLAVDLGIPGLLVWLALVVTTFRCAWRLRVYGQHVGQPLPTILGVAVLGSLTVYLVHGLTDAVTWGMVRTAVVIWGVLGVAFTTYRSMFSARTYRANETSDLSPALPSQPTSAGPLLHTQTDDRI